MPRKRVDPIARFWAKVDTSGGPDACWPWMGSRTKGGYGEMSIDGEVTYMHRFAWAVLTGSAPVNHVLHRCDNPPCCNPAHLFLGTPADNAADKVAKGRQQRGERAGVAKLRDADVLIIKQRLAAGENGAQLAREYGVTKGTISHIKTGYIRAWQHI